jgi:formyl-CoA transferase
MSTGIAHTGRRLTASARPVPLPVRALDHATGYLLAAAALAGLALRHADGLGSEWRASLARTAALLIDEGLTVDPVEEEFDPDTIEGGRAVELTAWGPLRRLEPPVRVAGAPLRWVLPARRLGSDAPRWDG